MEADPKITIVFLILALIAVFVCEHVVASRWPRWYVVFGIPIYRASVDIRSNEVRLLSEVLLNSDSWLSDYAILLPIEFRCISSECIAFRTRLALTNLVLPYIGLMRGLVQLNRDAKVVEITGFLNYWYVVFAITFTYIIYHINGAAPISAGLFLGIIFVYGIQSGQFRRIIELIVFSKNEERGRE